MKTIFLFFSFQHQSLAIVYLVCGWKMRREGKEMERVTLFFPRLFASSSMSKSHCVSADTINEKINVTKNVTQ